MKIGAGLIVVLVSLVSGCGTPSAETGRRDRDAEPYRETETADQPASLFEMSFGGGETEVTKNLPADAAEKVGTAVKSLQGKSPPDTIGE